MDQASLHQQLQRIRIRERSWLARMAAFKLRSRGAALVLGRTVHLHRITAHQFLSNQRLLLHELCHVRQYQRYGFFGFLARYLWLSLRHGYYNNPLEAEAREAEEDEIVNSE
jgi:Domain of unknown function (DUF4157)